MTKIKSILGRYKPLLIKPKATAHLRRARTKITSGKHFKLLGIVGALIALITFFVKDEISATYSSRLAALDQSYSRFDDLGSLVDLGAKLDKTSNLSERVLDANHHYLRQLQIEEEEVNWHSYDRTLTLVSDFLSALRITKGPEVDLLATLKSENKRYGDDIDEALKDKMTPEEAENDPPMMLTLRGMALEAHLGGLVSAVKSAALARRSEILQALTITRWGGGALFLLGWITGLVGQLSEHETALAEKTRRRYRAGARRISSS